MSRSGSSKRTCLALLAPRARRDADVPALVAGLADAIAGYEDEADPDGVFAQGFQAAVRLLAEELTERGEQAAAAAHTDATTHILTWGQAADGAEPVDPTYALALHRLQGALTAAAGAPAAQREALATFLAEEPDVTHLTYLFLDLVHEAVALEEAGPGDDLPLGATRLGGIPDLPAAWPWPQNDQGRPLGLLAQVRLSSLALPGLPARGMLYFFTDLAAETPVESHWAPTSWQVLIHPTEDDLVRGEAGAAPVWPAIALTPTRFLSVEREGWKRRLDPVDRSPARFPLLQALHQTLIEAEPVRTHQLLGDRDPSQGVHVNDGERWEERHRLLLALGPSGGGHAFWLPARDLARGVFDPILGLIETH